MQAIITNCDEEHQFTPILKHKKPTRKQNSVSSLPTPRNQTDERERYRFVRSYSLRQTKRRFARSRRISMRTAAAALQTFRRSVIIFDKADMCLCGLLSLSLSVHLICCIEVFFSMVLLIQAPDLLTMDGSYFYFLGTFDGSGSFFFALHLIVCSSCVVTAILLYVGSRLQSPRLLLPHIFWQICFIILSFVISTVLISLAKKGKMLMPSSIVLSIMLLTAGGVEIWWGFLSVSYYRQLRKKSDSSKKNSIGSFTEIPSTQC